MNKIQIKAEFVMLLSKLELGSSDCLDSINALKSVGEEKYITGIALKEAVSCDEKKLSKILFILDNIVDKHKLEGYLWEYIKDNEYPDSLKIAAFNILSRFNPDCSYLSVKDYIADLDEIIEDETKEVLASALMNPEAQIDFMDFLKSLGEDDKIALLDSLKEDYDGDALANIIIPVFLYAPNSREGMAALNLLGDTRSQLAYHELEKSLAFVSDDLKPIVNKNMSKLKLSGIRVDETLKFYKEVLSVSQPYKSIVSYPDGHGNMAIIFTRKRSEDNSIQLLAIVINNKYGMLDSFGFNSITEDDYLMIKDRFVNGSRCAEISPGFVKYLSNLSEKISRENNEIIPYEYICWRSILSDIEEEQLDFTFEQTDLSRDDIENLFNLDFIEKWFFDIYTSDEFAEIIKRLNAKLRANQFGTNFTQFVTEEYDNIFTEEEIKAQNGKILLAAYLKRIEGNNELACKIASLQNNKEFFTNILKRSIYEHYIGKRWQLQNESKTLDVFSKRSKTKAEDFKRLELDLIITGIESEWVQNA